jgi:hypothetical protein
VLQLSFSGFRILITSKRFIHLGFVDLRAAFHSLEIGILDAACSLSVHELSDEEMAGGKSFFGDKSGLREKRKLVCKSCKLRRGLSRGDVGLLQVSFRQLPVSSRQSRVVFDLSN